MIRDLFVDPEAFFESVADGEAGLLWPLVVVLLVAVTAALTVLPGFLAGQAAMEGPGGGPGAIIILFPLATSFIGVLVGFLVYAGLFHGTSTVVFGSDGPFSESLVVAGWGYVPALAGTLLTLLVYVYVYQTVTLPSNPMQMFQAVARIMDRPIFLAAWLLGFAFLLWQAFLWVVGLERVRDLTVREAVITVAIPVVIDVLGRVYFRFFFGPPG